MMKIQLSLPTYARKITFTAFCTQLLLLSACSSTKLQARVNAPNPELPQRRSLLIAQQKAPELYDRQTLEYWQQRYSKSTTRILKEGLEPHLTSQERQALFNLKLSFPLRDPELMGFYASYPPPKIVFPVEGLKFLDDLCIAYAWLWDNNYRLETIEEYVAMLRYKKQSDFPGGRYPKPFEALGIPANALQNQKVDDMSLRLFNSARAFILAHELAHLHYRHTGGKVKDEIQADQFAVELLSRTNTIPMGAILFFQALAHLAPNRAQFSSEAAWQKFLEEEKTHPLNSERIRAIANNLNQLASQFPGPSDPNPRLTIETVQFVATGLAPVAAYLDDSELQLCVAEMAANADLSTLKPRKGKKSFLNC